MVVFVSEAIATRREKRSRFRNYGPEHSNRRYRNIGIMRTSTPEKRRRRSGSSLYGCDLQDRFGGMKARPPWTDGQERERGITITRATTASWAASAEISRQYY